MQWHITPTPHSVLKLQLEHQNNLLGGAKVGGWNVMSAASCVMPLQKKSNI